eukprot:761322-Hanusia_phi.AAC.3
MRRKLTFTSADLRSDISAECKDITRFVTEGVFMPVAQRPDLSFTREVWQGPAEVSLDRTLLARSSAL